MTYPFNVIIFLTDLSQNKNLNIKPNLAIKSDNPRPVNSENHIESVV